MKFLRRLRLTIASFFSPWKGFGGCARCGARWTTNNHHSTPYAYRDDPEQLLGSAGAFPLCIRCWQAMTPAQRLPWYRMLVREWELIENRLTPGEQKSLYDNVMKGL